MSKVDFQQPFDNDQYFQEYLKSKEINLKKQAVSIARPEQSTQMWILVFVLMVSMVALGVVSLLQYRELQSKVSELRGSVAGINENTSSVQNIITADGFSLVIDQPTPGSFTNNRITSKSKFLENKPSTTTQILSISDDGSKKSGLEIEVIEYDNAMDRNAFSQLVLQKLGSEYQILSQDLTIPQETQLTQIQNNNGDLQKPNYYTTVTAQNYYIITIHQQRNSNEETDIARFTDSMVSSLYLN